MRNIFLQSVVLLITLNVLAKKLHATHVAGAEISYEWIADSTYRILYKYYHDCRSIIQTSTIEVCYYNSCDGFFNKIVLNKINTMPNGVPNGFELDAFCPGYPTNCTIPSSSLPGYREWWYSGTVTLPSRCDKWTFFYGSTNTTRTNSATNLQLPGSASPLYLEATLDNFNAQGNSTVSFSAKTVPYVCNNVPFVWNDAPYDKNNDSLVFEMIQPLTGGYGANACGVPNGTSIPYNTAMGVEPAYNPTTNPFATNNTFRLNFLTGEMTFTPSMVQNGVIAMRVNEYRNGKIIGSTMREIQITVLNCGGIRQPQTDIISSSISAAAYNGSEIVACIGQPLSFCYKGISTYWNASLTVTDDHGTSLPGASVTYADLNTDSVTGCVSWTPQMSDTGLKIFTARFLDSSCIPPGVKLTRRLTIPIRIFSGISILENVGICPGDSIQLTGIGQGSFIWSVLPGGSALSSLSCTNCANPIAKPNITTSYVLTTSTTNNSCGSYDTTRVVVGAPVVAMSDVTTCVNNQVELKLSFPLAPANITYDVKWTPAMYLSNDTIANPILSADKNIQYTVRVASLTNPTCFVVDTVNVNVLQGYTIYNTNTIICAGEKVQVIGNGDSRYTYTWSPATGVSRVNSLVPTIQPDSSTLYTVTASYPGCKDSMMSFYIDTACSKSGLSAVTSPVPFALLQNYPNPYTGATIIPFVLGEQANVCVDIYDVVGKKISSMKMDNLPAGQQTISIDANRLGIAAGNYIYRVEIVSDKGRYSQCKRMTVQ